jgi:uncharacterized membrane protein
MPVESIAFLALVIGALSLFGGVLAWASWMEWRQDRRKSTRQQARPEPARKAPSHAPLHRAF